MIRILPSSKESKLRAFIARLYPPAAEAFYGPDGVVDRLGDAANIELRNQAVHDTQFGREDARTAREWALGVLGRL